MRSQHGEWRKVGEEEMRCEWSGGKLKWEKPKVFIYSHLLSSVGKSYNSWAPTFPLFHKSPPVEQQRGLCGALNKSENIFPKFKATTTARMSGGKLFREFFHSTEWLSSFTSLGENKYVNCGWKIPEFNTGGSMVRWDWKLVGFPISRGMACIRSWIIWKVQKTLERFNDNNDGVDVMKCIHWYKFEH